MIVFCEDCGAKNSIARAELAGGRAVFKCTSCGYGNRYALESRPGSYINKADRLGKKIASIPDIVGTFVFHATEGVLKCDMPGELDREDILPLGRILFKNLSQGLSWCDDITEMALFISNRNLLVKPIDNQGFFAVVCKTNHTLRLVSGALGQKLTSGRQEHS